MGKLRLIIVVFRISYFTRLFLSVEIDVSPGEESNWNLAAFIFIAQNI